MKGIGLESHYDSYLVCFILLAQTFYIFAFFPPTGIFESGSKFALLKSYKLKLCFQARSVGNPSTPRQIQEYCEFWPSLEYTV